jgi:hypothetical protein
MDVNRITSAIDRITRAADRIEKFPVADGEATLGLRLSQISLRHEKLRDEVQQVLTDLDALVVANNEDAEIA